jgi:hypothetical protein
MWTLKEMLFAQLLVFVFLFCDTDAAGFTIDQFKHAKLVGKDDLPGFKQSETIRVLYYFHTGECQGYIVILRVEKVNDNQ